MGAYRTIRPSLVLIQTKSQGPDGQERDGLGSGVVISGRGEILTALHVVTNAATIQLTFADGTRSSGQVISFAAIGALLLVSAVLLSQLWHPLP